ncbi:hypothetical protein L9F63_004131, partial [Diploptera punctata]
MSRSSGYNSHDDIHMDTLGEDRRRRVESSTLGRPVQILPRVRLKQGATPYQFNTQSMNRTSTQPRRSFSSKKQVVLNDLPSRYMGDMPGESTASIPLLTPRGNESEENHAAKIVSEMEKDTALMEDNPVSEQLRMETLREMPESLTMKRTVKKKLVKSVSQKSKHSPLSMWKRFKYRVSMSFTKFNVEMKNVLYTLELWYSSLKQIEGHFGSGVATYFRFLRWLFLLNTIVFLISFGFVVIPQLLYRFYEPAETVKTLKLLDENNTSSHLDPGFLHYEEKKLTKHRLTPLPLTTVTADPTVLQPRVRSQPYSSNADFNFGNIFTGEGFFTDTTLFYGYYTNESVSLVSGLEYQMPLAYFFTMLACYLFIFVTLSVSMARSYRKTFIETTGDLKNIFALKVFCGWDFSIATDEAAALKSKSIYNDLAELLEDLKKDTDELSLRQKLAVFLLRLFLNVFVLVILIGIGVLIWVLLREETAALAMPVIITLIIMIGPVIFSYLARQEMYTNPRNALFVTLLRSFLMEGVVVGVVVAFWLTRKKSSDCWQTSLGQEVYRLVVTDFLLAVIGTSLAELLRVLIHKSVWKRIGAPEFDIARNTLNLIYNQVLFFIGFYFSPLLAFIVILKMFIMFYIKKLGVMHNCEPSARPWRAAQTQTVFLVLSFIASLIVLILLGYVVVQVDSSQCGPFHDYSYPYEMILGMFQAEDKNTFLTVINFIVKPGVTAGILLAMCVGVYYLRAKSHAHRSMVHILREMLVLEAKDKEFLLRSISRVTEGQWMYNLKTGADSSARSQLSRRSDNVDYTSSSSSSSAGHGSHSTDGFSQGDAGFRKQRPYSTNMLPTSSSDEHLLDVDYKYI